MAKKAKDSQHLITILGPTATGKTQLAAQVARRLNGEIISADSRQVYRGMDLGTGKDYADYHIEGQTIPYHLIDIAEPGYEYSVFEFQRDFIQCFLDIQKRENQAILCGGTGLYIEAALAEYQLQKVPVNESLRRELEQIDRPELQKMLEYYRSTHNTTDTLDRQRTMRAIEIALYERENPTAKKKMPAMVHHIFGISLEREIVRERITHRLKERLDAGMIDEVKGLLNSGLKAEQLTFYGLEYRYLTDYVCSKISYDEMFTKLNTAIHQFAKRQMTWYRRMEKQGRKINWVDGLLDIEEKTDFICKKL